jgi:hypothetical protein
MVEERNFTKSLEFFVWKYTKGDLEREQCEIVTGAP